MKVLSVSLITSVILSRAQPTLGEFVIINSQGVAYRALLNLKNFLEFNPREEVV